MKFKKLSACFFAVMMITSMITSAMAAEPVEKVVDLGDGFYMVETVEYLPAPRAGNLVVGQKNATVYNGSTVIGTATLKASFDISGAVARATAATITGTGQNGWSYDHGTTSLSGNKAYGTAYFKSGSTTKSLTLTLTCSPDGTIS